MTFVEFMEREVGPKWVVARRTPKNLHRYPDSVFLTRTRYAALARAYEAETGNEIYKLPASEKSPRR